MHNAQLAKGIYYVGAVDWNLRDFHGYSTPRGVTYNSYLIIDEKICLVDTVKRPFAGELLERIARVVDPSRIDYVIVNHVEPDHSGSLPVIMEKAPNAKVVLTEHGRKEVIKYYGKEYDFHLVKSGDSLDIGKGSLQFIPLPMVHWPDSMATFLTSENILFSNDAFGQHICTSKRFDDENNLHELLYEAGKYYANILMPFGKLITKALPQISMLPIKMIAPSHGIIWRSHISEIISKYSQWSSGFGIEKVVIVYDSMWGSTEMMARRILEGISATGVEVKLFRMAASERSEIAEAILEARGILIGSSTINNGPLATIGGLLTYIKGLRPAGKLGAAFGAYGWGGGSQKVIEETLAQSAVTVEASGLTLQWKADREELDRCFDFGVQFGKKIKQWK